LGIESIMRKAIVCGSGVAGLSAAIALSLKGWPVDVYERDSAVREIGAGIFVKANGLRVLKTFGILDRIRRDCVVLKEARTLDKNGHVLQRRTLHELNPVWNIQRQLLIRALFERATELGARVHTDHAVEAVSPDGTVTARGRQFHADLVVAADGVNSRARHMLGLDRPVREPLSGAIRLLVPRTAHEADDAVMELWSGRLRVGISPCTPTDVFSYLIAPLDDKRGSRLPLDTDYWSAHFPKLTSEGFFRRAAMATGVHHRYPMVGTLSWVQGCVALVGDAAHALPPTLGQGAGLSLTNSLLLSHYVSSDDDLHRALASWEREWRWISDRTQVWARRYDWITSEWPRSVYPLRNAVIWGIGKSLRFNSYMRIADRIDAANRTVLPASKPAGPSRSQPIN
jgi:2-polyprenyl-6-methoxyphenol hydroxylase-like FAD-dependent oxidoreductase